MNARGPSVDLPIPRCYRCHRLADHHTTRWLEPVVEEQVTVHRHELLCPDGELSVWTKIHRVSICALDGRVLESFDALVSNRRGPPSFMTALVDEKCCVFDLDLRSCGADFAKLPYELFYREVI